ncbi:MAG: hypothetical protein L6V87_00515 [Ruminococcus sp.]|nr:MAG: hypothetical protein L6V87_00515 [Ruminococcus sp.]
MKTYKMITSAVLAAMFLSGCGTQSGTITTITAPASETEGEASAIVSETAEETSVEAETEAAAAEETSEMEETISELFLQEISSARYMPLVRADWHGAASLSAVTISTRYPMSTFQATATLKALSEAHTARIRLICCCITIPMRARSFT